MRYLALAIVLYLLPQDEKITLKFVPKQGDQLTQTTKFEVKITCTIDAAGETQEMEVEHRGSEKTVTEYVEVADAKPTPIVIDCLENYEESKQTPSKEWVREDSPWHGRKVTIFLKDGKVTREGVEGMKESEVEEVGLDDENARLFPKHPVRVGDTWEFKGDEVRKSLGLPDEIKDGKVKLKLASIKEIEKRRCAVLEGKFELTGKAEDDMDLTVKLDADIVVWIERGYTMSVKGKGKVTIKGENDDFSMKGDGPITLELVTKVK
jgi:hypothetical protein